MVALKTLAFIQMAKELGFSLLEIKDFVDMHTSDEVELGTKSSSLDQKLSSLKKIIMYLEEFSQKQRQGEECLFVDLIEEESSE